MKLLTIAALSVSLLLPIAGCGGPSGDQAPTDVPSQPSADDTFKTDEGNATEEAPPLNAADADG